MKAAFQNGSALSALVALLAWAAPLQAGDFFDIIATGSGGTTVHADGSNIIHLTDNLIRQQREFSSLQGQNVTAAMSFGGLPNAVVFTENAAQSQATLSFPVTGFSKAFTAAGSGDLDYQIRDFLESDSDGAYARLLQAVDRMSPAAAIDGNPQASTAIIANDAFERFGSQNDLSQTGANYYGARDFTLDLNGGFSHGGGLNGNWADWNIGGAIRLTDQIALALNTTIDSRNEGGSDADTFAEEVGLPLTIVNDVGELNWQVTPWAFGGLSEAYDQAAGTVLVGGGGTSDLALWLGDFKLTLADQISYAGGAPANVNGYAFDVPVDQWLVKNGLNIAYQPRYTPFVVDAGLAYSDFLHRAAVPNFCTPSVGFAFQFNQYSWVRIGYAGDFAPRYNDNGGELAFYFAF